MAEKLRDFFVSFDSFGEPISINYKGETSYKTGVGALFSLVIKSFLLIYATQQILTLLNYEEPAITQVSLTTPKAAVFSSQAVSDIVIFPMIPVFYPKQAHRG